MTVATLTATGSKPDAIDALRSSLRKSAEHKTAQIKRFLYGLAGVIGAQLVGDVAAGKDPLSHFADARTAAYFVIPFAWVALRQIHPSLTVSQIDSVQGVTIVPEQIGLPATPVESPAADPAPQDDPVEPAPDASGLDTLPTGDFSADGTPAPPDYPAPEGDAAP